MGIIPNAKKEIAVEENTDKYDHVIEEYGKKTEAILNELELLNK
jgi:hypothetical protein